MPSQSPLTTSAKGPPRIGFGAVVGPRDIERMLRSLRKSAEPYAPIFDLSQVQKIDFESIARVVITIDRFERMGTRAYMIPPTPIPFESELRKLHELRLANERKSVVAASIEAAPAQRQACLDNLSRWGIMDLFGPNLMGDGLGLLPLTDTLADLRNEDARLVRNTVAYRWFPASNHLSADPLIADNFAELFAQAGQYIPTASARDLFESLIGEVVINVADHASLDEQALRKPRGLVGARVNYQGSTLTPHQSTLSNADKDFEAWVGGLRVPTVECVVADSGVGIVATLAEAYRSAFPQGPRAGGLDEEIEIVRFALSELGSRRLSTTSSIDQDKPVIRGLARTLQAVQENQGMIAIRTGRILAGYAYPEGRPAWIQRAQLPICIGTTVRVVLPAYRRAKRDIGLAGTRGIAPSRSPLEVVDASYAHPEKVRDAVGARLGKGSSQKTVVITPTDWELANRTTRDALLLQCQRVASIFQNSALLVLWLPADSPEATVTFNAIDKARWSSSPSLLEREGLSVPHCPVMVVTGRRKIQFNGGSARLLGVLNRADPLTGRVAESDQLDARALIDESHDGTSWLVDAKEGIQLRVPALSLLRSIDDAAHAKLAELASRMES